MHRIIVRASVVLFGIILLANYVMGQVAQAPVAATVQPAPNAMPTQQPNADPGPAPEGAKNSIIPATSAQSAMQPPQSTREPGILDKKLLALSLLGGIMGLLYGIVAIGIRKTAVNVLIWVFLGIGFPLFYEPVMKQVNVFLPPILHDWIGIPGLTAAAFGYLAYPGRRALLFAALGFCLQTIVLLALAPILPMSMFVVFLSMLAIGFLGRKAAKSAVRTSEPGETLNIN